ncbi:hypothetical protein [Deinococcus hopiensis]|nr:hypothetical protein [Deinococcus hopiensis]
MPLTAARPVPGTMGGLYTLVLGATGFCVILGVYLHAHFTGRKAAAMTAELPTAVLAMLGVPYPAQHLCR